MDTGCSTKKVALDFSKIPYPSKPEGMVLWEVVLKCVIVGILLLVAVIGNSLVILIVFLFPKMRTTTNFYIVNLAIADLLVACFPMWIYVTTDVTDGFILGEFFCKSNALVQVGAMSAISFTMMVIAGDRFFAIVFPLKSRVTQRRVKVVVFFIWLFAISIGIPPLVFYEYTERQWLDYKETFCTDIWPMVKTSEGCDQGATSERVYWTIIVAALNWIPMLMMTVNYTLIIHKLRFARVAAHRGKDAISLVQRRSATKVIKMLFSLLIAFMVCTIPFQVSTLYENYKDKKTTLPSWYQPVYFSAINLMYGHSTINPIIYGALNHSFRTGFRHLIDRIRGHKLTSWDYTMNGGESVMRPSMHVVRSNGSGSGSGRDESNCGVTLTPKTVTKSQMFLDIPDDMASTICHRRRHLNFNGIDEDGIENDDNVGDNIEKHPKTSLDNNGTMTSKDVQHPKNGHVVVKIDQDCDIEKNITCVTQGQHEASLEHTTNSSTVHINNGSLCANGTASDFSSEHSHHNRQIPVEELVLATTYLNQALVID